MYFLYTCIISAKLHYSNELNIFHSASFSYVLRGSLQSMLMYSSRADRLMNGMEYVIKWMFSFRIVSMLYYILLYIFVVLSQRFVFSVRVLCTKYFYPLDLKVIFFFTASCYSLYRYMYDIPLPL